MYIKNNKKKHPADPPLIVPIDASLSFIMIKNNNPLTQAFFLLFLLTSSFHFSVLLYLNLKYGTFTSTTSLLKKMIRIWQ